MNTSKTKATVGRVLLAFCPDLWNGPQPAIVTKGAFAGPLDRFDLNQHDTPQTVQGDAQFVNVNVLVDGATNPKALEYFRSVETGNTLANVPVFDAQEDIFRAIAFNALKRPVPLMGELGERTPVAWVEWPGVPAAAAPAGDVSQVRVIDPGPLLSHRPDDVPPAWSKAGDEAMKRAVGEGKSVKEAEDLAIAAARAASKQGDPYFVEPKAGDAAETPVVTQNQTTPDVQSSAETPSTTSAEPQLTS